MKMDKQLKAYVDAGKKNTRVLGPLERHLILSRKNSDRRVDVLHPSDIVGNDWCH